MPPKFFATPPDFRRWLEANHDKADELVVGFHKVGSGKPSITWPESVDEALCFGWIDGIRRSLGETSYTIRFTPRRARSTWSLVNLRRYAALEKAGLVSAAGRAAFARRSADRTGIYSFEQRKSARLTAAERAEFDKDPKAWAFFTARPPGYQRTAIFWVQSAKKEETRAKRLRTLISDSAAARTIAPLTRPAARPSAAKAAPGKKTGAG